MISIPVHMYAFANPDDKSEIRHVDLPIYTELPDGLQLDDVELDKLLEMVFRYGQNDYQPQPMPSVSVGDVIQVFNRYFMVKSMGFKELSKEEFGALVVPTSLQAYGFQK